ncbi:carotenoid 1,2-hydratase [Dechloromonas sp.]|uniref:lipocalin-like domain-containing protein n=1 Tax=Dechloromonas sp. TaxID=1917218 RepID=UPI00122B6A1E|nr:carotenoid 1,2-hydratase [Dechloromonas sp.]MBU3696998.1 carotenoid 1,2-hydratase [Dechloromonas sp.]TEX49576.1 MAG: carotenoid 1,2-hydratase [Rhodocyclaceae bacterium]
MQRRQFLLALAATNGLLTGPSAAVDFPPVRPGRKLAFPNDFGAHPDFRTEWWYATGWLRRSDGRPLGFQITFFRVRTGIGETSASRFAPRQLLLAHAAIADPALGRLRHAERAVRVGVGDSGFREGYTQVWIGDWRLAQDGDHYQTNVQASDFAYDLKLATNAPPLLNGQGGYSSKSSDPRHASYYYSRPQLAVSGSVSLAGRPEAVTGRAWLDHEWSSELLPADAQGWDWVGINLHDGGGLMAFRLRDTRGNAHWAAASLRSTGKIDQIYPPQAVDFLPQRRWRSPRTGIDYPVAWQLHIGPRRFELNPLFDDQELDSRRTVGAVYWEGAIRASENGQPVGEGYLELAGYGEKLRIG